MNPVRLAERPQSLPGTGPGAEWMEYALSLQQHLQSATELYEAKLLAQEQRLRELEGLLRDVYVELPVPLRHRVQRALSTPEVRKMEEVNWKRRAEQAEAELDRVQILAKGARARAAAPDYDEEEIRDALWAVVDAALAPPEENEEPPATEKQP